MSNDDLLRGYRPAGPPTDLRARIVSGTDPRSAKAVAERPRLRDWLPAAAAVVLIVILHVVAAGIRDRAYDQISPGDVPLASEVLLR